ncbi:MAG: serine/threonine protein kinase, partial [Terriglobales bacterium]
MQSPIIAYKACSSCGAQFRNSAAAETCPYEGTPLSAVTTDPLVGTIIQGKFEVLAMVGLGGWSVVYKARHLGLNKFVALKFLHKHFVDDREKILRFHNEAKAVATISHPNIVFIHDFGLLDNGLPYIAMDFLEGETLAHMLAQRHRLNSDEIIDLFSQACCALTAAHEIGIIHRDIKPSNMVVTENSDGKPHLVICDFGLAKLTSIEESLSLTRTGQTLGTPAYMSPEQ